MRHKYSAFPIIFSITSIFINVARRWIRHIITQFLIRCKHWQKMKNGVCSLNISGMKRTFSNLYKCCMKYDQLTPKSFKNMEKDLVFELVKVTLQVLDYRNNFQSVWEIIKNWLEKKKIITQFLKNCVNPLTIMGY